MKEGGRCFGVLLREKDGGGRDEFFFVGGVDA